MILAETKEDSKAKFIKAKITLGLAALATGGFIRVLQHCGYVTGLGFLGNFFGMIAFYMFAIVVCRMSSPYAI